MTKSNNKPVRAIDLAASVPWAIRKDALENIFNIARRENDIEAVQAKLGRPLANTRRTTVRGSTAIIPVIGPIFRYANLFTEVSGATSLSTLATDLQVAADDPAIDSIVLEIDSPGGQASGVSEFASMVSGVDKRVTAYVSADGCSAAYWIASAADELVIADTAIVGSIGVVAGFSTDKDESKLEIVSSQSPNKRVDVTTDEGRASVQKTIDDLAEVFVSAVAKFRGVNRETVLSKFGAGGVLVGELAVSAGMADRIGSLESVIAGLSGSSNEKGANTMADQNKPDSKPVLTVEALKADNPGVFQAVFDQGAEHGKQAEQQRIKEVEAAGDGFAGHEDLIAGLKYDGKTTGGEAAMAVIQAEKENRAKGMQTFKDTAPQPVDQPANDLTASSKQKKGDMSFDERCEAEWSASSELRAEFGNDFDSYKAFAEAQDGGLVKIHGKK